MPKVTNKGVYYIHFCINIISVRTRRIYCVKVLILANYKYLKDAHLHFFIE